MTVGTELVRGNFERREPRCRVCREEALRIWVNSLLDWRGTPIIRGGRKTHVVTYADILRELEPLNEGRAQKDRITYSCLWVHARRHHDVDAVAAYEVSRMVQRLVKALRRPEVPTKLAQSRRH